VSRILVPMVAVVMVVGVLAAASGAGDRPFGAARQVSPAFIRPADGGGGGGVTDAGGPFSKSQIERFRCSSAGAPAAFVDISCNTTEYGQDWAPDNELAVSVNPTNPNHIVAGSNDYFYRFNNSTGARQALVLTGFFTSFDGGATWIDGQIPVRSGNGAGDPAPAFDRRSGAVLMAQLENTAGQGGLAVAQGDVSVSRSTDGGVTWSEPVTVFKGQGAGIGPANNAKFYDKEWLTCDNSPASRFFGRCYVTTTLFQNGLQGSFVSSDIFISWSDDGGRTWTNPRSIAVTHPSCTFQTTGPEGSRACDENQFSIAETAANGDLYIHFQNFQNEAAWEAEFDFDSQIMVIRSTNGGASFGPAGQAAQLEDGLSDMPWSVIGRQTVWGHQIRWASEGNISVNPNNPLDVTVIFSDRGTPNPNASDACVDAGIGTAPNYDPCQAGPNSNTNVYISRSLDGGATWTGRQVFDAAPGHQWFPWGDHKSDGTLAVAWDEDVQPAGGAMPANDQFVHVLRTSSGKQTLGPLENIDVSVTHWAGQYVGEPDWPRVCGPVGYSDPPVVDARGKDCNEFHGDYTGLAVDSLDRVHVVWTGLNRFDTSLQIDPYTGGRHDGYVQDAMYARR
jgi:hypothetical protein